MKDVIVTASRIKTELYTLLTCFILANLLNVYAIFEYKTSFSELFSMIGYVILFTFTLYFCWTFIRIILYFLKKLFKSNKIQN